MQKISDPFELEKLANNLKKWDEIDKQASIEYLRKYPEAQKSFLGKVASIFASKKVCSPEMLKARNAARFAAFPNEVEISPEIALLLYTEDKGYAEKSNAIDEKYGGVAKVFLEPALGTPIRLALMALWPSPYNIANQGEKITRSFAGSFSYSRELEKLIQERKRIIEPVLGNYKLIEKEPGKYLLKLQEFEEVIYSEKTGHCSVQVIEKEVRGAGIDPNFNPANLPPLPKITRGGPGASI